MRPGWTSVHGSLHSGSRNRESQLSSKCDGWSCYSRRALNHGRARSPPPQPSAARALKRQGQDAPAWRPALGQVSPNKGGRGRRYTIPDLRKRIAYAVLVDHLDLPLLKPFGDAA